MQYTSLFHHQMVAKHTQSKKKQEIIKLHRYPQTSMHNKHIFGWTIFLILQLIFNKYENNENS